MNLRLGAASRARNSIIILGLLALTGCTPTTPFTDVTRETGLHEFVHSTGARGDYWMPEILGSGVAFLDWDSDSWPDIMVASGGSWDTLQPPAARIYRNTRDGKFREVTEETGLMNIRGYSFGISSADIDNDGDQDVYLTTLGTNILLRNDYGIFTDVSRHANVEGPPEWSTAALFFDADRDGWLDLYVGGYVDWEPSRDIRCTGPDGQKIYCTPHLYNGLHHRFYRNRGDGTFEDRSLQSGLLPTTGKTLGAVSLDINHDLWPDLAIANDLAPDQLYINNGDTTFTEQGIKSGMAFDVRGIATAGMGIDAGYIDGSGETTIVIGNFSNQMVGVFKHMSDGRFMDASASSGIGGSSRLTLAFGLMVLDANLDGHQDIFVANGHIHRHEDETNNAITFKQRPHYFVNQGAGTFTDKGNTLPAMLGRGAAYADMDHDGDLDIVVTENGGRMRLLRNNADGHFLRVSLRGNSSNRDGIGARLDLYTHGRRQTRHVAGGGSYLSQSEHQATFGTDGVRRADSLVIRWPSGKIQSVRALPADLTLLVVTEPS